MDGARAADNRQLFPMKFYEGLDSVMQQEQEQVLHVLQTWQSS